MAADGLITIKSSFRPEQTMKRLEAEVKAKRLTVFAHVDHAAGAAAVNLPLRPTDLLIFGDARGGTCKGRKPSASTCRSKRLSGRMSLAPWLSYNDPAFLAHRHGLGKTAKDASTAIAAALNAIATKAASPP